MDDGGEEGRQAGEGDVTTEEHELWLRSVLRLP